jgi:hypothetical protein
MGIGTNLDYSLQQALQMHRNGRLKEAEKLYKTIIAAEPRHFDANQLLGVSFLAQGRHKAAERQIRLAIRIDPHHAVLHNNLAAALLEQGRFEDCLASCDTAIDLNSDYPEALFNRGLALEKLSRQVEAVQSLERAIALKPDYQMALSHRARLMREIGSPDHMNPKLNQQHPIDLQLGIDTSGYITIAYPEGVAPEKTVGYAGVQPSIVRQLLNKIPDIGDYAFFDLGCGKGRALVVASEYPLRRVVGIEISPDLAAVARRNAEIIRTKCPERTAVEVVEGNAADVSGVGGKVILFLYNPFGVELMRQLQTSVEAGLTGPIEHLYVVYHNAREAEVFDGSESFSRCFAGLLQADALERPFGYAIEGPTVVWQSRRGLNASVALAWAQMQWEAARLPEAAAACEAVLAVQPDHAEAKALLRRIRAPRAATPFLPGLKVGGPLSLDEQIRRAIGRSV